MLATAAKRDRAQPFGCLFALRDGLKTVKQLWCPSGSRGGRHVDSRAANTA